MAKVCTPQATSDFDHPGDEPASFFLAWAEVLPLQSTEKINGLQQYSDATHRITIRRVFSEIGTGHYVEVNGKRYDILGVQEVGGDGQYMELIVGSPATAGGERMAR